MTLGSLIRKARIDAGFSIEELGAQTNIRPTLLKAIESNQFGQCGGETYARGHLRNIAKKLKINPADFLSLYEQEQINDSKSLNDSLIESNVINLPTQGYKISWKVLASISLIGLAVVGLVQIVISNSSTKKVATVIEEKVSASPSSLPVQPTPGNTISTGKGVEVIVTATRARSWILVSDSTGSSLFTGQLAKGEIKTFSTWQTLNFKFGNAGGVDLIVNGKKISSIGGDGEVVNTSFGVNS